jgi:general secretion pathway protein H
VRWVPLPPGSEDHFRFVGLTDATTLPRRWLDPQVSVEDGAAQGVLLGPEPVIGVQRIVLRLDGQRIEVRSDGLGPFEPGDSGAVQ